MDSVYNVGALCQFISSKGKINKNGKFKTENVETSPNLETNHRDLSIEKKSENLKKRKLNTNVNAFLSVKKTKADENIQTNELKITDTELQTNYLGQKSNYDLTKTIKKPNLNLKTSFEKPINKVKHNSIKFNSDSKRFKKNVPYVKSSEYIENESRTIFVGNVSVNVKMSVIKDTFKQFGEIESMRLRSVSVNTLKIPKRVAIIRKQFHPQRSTANIYIRYKTLEQAQNALTLNATQFDGHTIRVDMALNSNHKQNKKKGLFIGNLPYNIEEDEVWNFFKDSGRISAVRIVRDNMTGVCKGFGYVEFESKESVELAMQLQGKKIQNRVIRIKRIESKPNTNTSFNNKKPSFKKKTKPIDSQNFQGVTEQKMEKKKFKPTKTDLTRRKFAKQLNA